jgi:hypothetical protein
MGGELRSPEPGYARALEFLQFHRGAANRGRDCKSAVAAR